MTRPDDDEFAEFDMTEAEFDEIIKRGEPAKLISGPARRRQGWTMYFSLGAAQADNHVLTEPNSRAFGEQRVS